MSKHRRSVLAFTVVLILAGFALADAAWSGQATIIRDEYGVPHVFGDGLKSTWFGVGYASGQDRLWQADLHRRAATGNLAEFFGPSSIAGDVQARSVFGPESFRKALFRGLPKEEKKVLRAYVAGMNAWIDEATATGQLPVEYEGLGLPPPVKWTLDDSIAWLMAFGFGFGERGADELDFFADLTTLGGANSSTAVTIFFDSHWVSDPTAFTSVPASTGASAVGSPGSAALVLPDLPDFDARRAADVWRRAWAGWEKNLRRAGIRRGPASNAIAISANLSATGYPLLLGGPQMGYTTPQQIHEMGVHGGGYNVSGMALAGVPGILIGVNKKVAWTFTTGGTDNSDIYLETLNPSNPGEYLYNGAFRPFDCRVEAIPVRGTNPVQQVLCRSVHGSVIGQVPGLALTLKRALRGVETSTLESVLKLNKAGSINKVDKALQKFVHNFNILAADTKGNIYYRHNGLIPIRAAGDSPFFPHSGTGQAEWQGFIPFDAMPHIKNPDQGWLVSWNNKPQVNWFNSTRGFNQWGPVARVQTLANVLGTIPPGAATVGLIEQINLIGGWTTDTPSGNASTVVVSTLLPDLLGQVDASADARLAGILGILSSWDTLQLDLNVDGRYDSPAVAIFNTWWQELINRVFADDLLSTMEKNVVANMAGRLLRPGLVPLRHDYLGGETVGGAVTGALIATLDRLAGEYSSSDPADWLQTAAMITWDAIGAVQVPDTPWMNRGTYNQITRLAPGKIFAQNVVAPGQSGNPFSPHFADQLLNYATWQYKEMRLTKGAVTSNAASTLVVKTKSNKARKARKERGDNK